MSYCDHCEGQRFDRARVLRALRQVQKDLDRGDCRSAREALDLALKAIKELEIPHLEFEEEENLTVH